MRVLGIDPGSLHTGYGVIDGDRRQYQLIAFGRINNSTKDNTVKRYGKIYKELKNIIKKTQPEIIVLENVIYCNNSKVAIKLGEARGVAILTASESSLPIAEYSPKRIKQAAVGNGNASKQQVQGMIQQLLGIKEQLSPDAADALAAAICHINNFRHEDTKPLKTHDLQTNIS